MALTGKIIGQVEIRSDGDVFHEIFRDRPHHVANMSPANIQGCSLQEGEWGKVGSVIGWNYTHDGKQKTTKQIIQAIDNGKKTATFKVVEGDSMELYKSLTITVQVDKKGQKNLVTWTFEYEKLDERVEDPSTLMDICLSTTRDIETHHLK